MDTMILFFYDSRTYGIYRRAAVLSKHASTPLSSDKIVLKFVIN